MILRNERKKRQKLVKSHQSPFNFYTRVLFFLHYKFQWYCSFCRRFHAKIVISQAFTICSFHFQNHQHFLQKNSVLGQLKICVFLKNRNRGIIFGFKGPLAYGLKGLWLVASRGHWLAVSRGRSVIDVQLREGFYTVA